MELILVSVVQWSMPNAAKSEVTEPMIIGNRSMIRMANRADQIEVVEFDFLIRTALG